MLATHTSTPMGVYTTSWELVQYLFAILNPFGVWHMHFWNFEKVIGTPPQNKRFFHNMVVVVNMASQKTNFNEKLIAKQRKILLPTLSFSHPQYMTKSTTYHSRSFQELPLRPLLLFSFPFLLKYLIVLHSFPQYTLTPTSSFFMLAAEALILLLPPPTPWGHLLYEFFLHIKANITGLGLSFYSRQPVIFQNWAHWTFWLPRHPHIAIGGKAEERKWAGLFYF